MQGVIIKTIEVLGMGGLVVFPSDTVYGLLVDATNESAVKKLIAFKNRPIGKPISIFVGDFDALQNQVVYESPAKNLIKELVPGPYTFILPSKHHVCSLLESEKGTLGVRIPDFPLVTDLVKAFGRPVSATSANLSGRSPHYSIESLLNQLPKEKKELIDHIVDIGKLPRHKPSTILDLTTPEVRVIRQGDIPFSQHKIFISHSPQETKEIAQSLLDSLDTSSHKPLIFIIQGELGAGKTLFVKAIGEKLGIFDITSPTYIIYYEYVLKNQSFKKLIHFDLYQVEEEDEYKHLGIEKMLDEKNILCFEWGEKNAAIVPLLKKKAKIVYIKISYISETEREISVTM